MNTTLALAAAALLAACTSPTSQPPAATVDACSAQAQAFAVPGVRVTEAVAVEGNTVRPPNVTTGPLLVAHCKLTGRMNERTGVDGKPYHIGFELRLPPQWNGRFLYQGGGGNDGVLRPAVGPQAAPGYALNRGFAVVTTDAGHQGPDASFGFDPIARVDNAYHAHDQVAVTAKEIVRRFYAKPAERSYFIGCSGGGRQGMMFTQRFPSYFDGVIAMAPAMRVSKGATIAAAWDTQALAAIAPQSADAQADREPGAQRCRPGAAAQGHPRGLRCARRPRRRPGLAIPAACRFDPRTLMCRGGKTAELPHADAGGRAEEDLRRRHRQRRPQAVLHVAVGPGHRPSAERLAPVEARHLDHRCAQLAPRGADAGRAAGLLRHAAGSLAHRVQFRLRPRSRAARRARVDLQHRRRRGPRGLSRAQRQAAVRARPGRPDLLARRDDRLLPALERAATARPRPSSRACS